MKFIDSNKNDLAWEAVRRNENYKYEYEKLPINENGEKLGFPRFNLAWGVRKAFDPNLSIYQIRERNNYCCELSQIYPYYDLYSPSPKPAVTQVDFPKIIDLKMNILKNGDLEEICNDDHLIKILVDFVNEIIIENKSRVIVSIDPLKSDEEIARLINDVKNIAVKNIKIESSDNEKWSEFIQTGLNLKNIDRKDKGENTRKQKINIGDIENYFCSLRRYDVLVEKFKEDYGEENLIIEDGIIKKPKGFSTLNFITLDEILDQEITMLERLRNEKDNPKKYKKDKELIKNNLTGDLEGIIDDLICRLLPSEKSKRIENKDRDIAREAAIDKIGEELGRKAKDAVRSRYDAAYKRAVDTIRAAPCGFAFTPIHEKKD